jgi:glycosyltransferase involved in cell wall biosynthesis
MPVSIIIPAYNEAVAIEEMVNRCRTICSPSDEIIVVDDGSRDNTALLAMRAGARVIIHPANKGKARALQTGFEAAANEVLVTIDADATYPPECIPELIHELPHADMVVGTRFVGRTAVQLPLHREWANRIGAQLVSHILGRPISDVTTGMRVFRKKWITSIPIHARGLDFEAELTARAISMGARYIEVPITVNHRKGQSSLRFFRDTAGFLVAVLRGKFA